VDLSQIDQTMKLITLYLNDAVALGTTVGIAGSKLAPVFALLRKRAQSSETRSDKALAVAVNAIETNPKASDARTTFEALLEAGLQTNPALAEDIYRLLKNDLQSVPLHEVYRSPITVKATDIDEVEGVVVDSPTVFRESDINVTAANGRRFTGVRFSASDQTPLTYRPPASDNYQGREMVGPFRCRHCGSISGVMSSNVPIRECFSCGKPI
jgi:hypothetical protein